MHINTSDEKDLVMLLNEGNEAAFEKLYHLYSNRLLGYLVRMLRSETFASELLQDAFVKIWDIRKNIDPAQSFRSYVFRISENLVYDFFRKAAHDKKLEAALINIACGEYLDVEEKFCRKEIDQLLRNAIKMLPPKRRQIFQLVKMEERPYEEVSMMLHVSTSTINDHVVKATKFIREKMQSYHVTTISVVLFFSYFIPLQA